METNNDNYEKRCNNALVLSASVSTSDVSANLMLDDVSANLMLDDVSANLMLDDVSANLMLDDVSVANLMLDDVSVANLMLDDVSVENWCKRVIELQEREYPGYSSLTSPTDLNHVVKKATSEIIDFMKSIGNDSMSTKGGSRPTEGGVYGKAKYALKVLVSYLEQHEVWKPSQEKPLGGEQLDQAYKDLYIPAYNRADRKFADPPIRMQNYALFSFQPTKGATPDNNGIYGFIKIRGAYNRLEELEEKAKELIQYFSAHQFFAVEVGMPTPLKEKLENKDMITEIEHPDAKHDMDVYTDLVRDQTAKEKQQIEEIKRLTEELKADVQKGPDDKEPLQRYLELVQKRATAAYVYTQHREHLAEYKTVVLATRKQIAEMDEQYPNLKDEYLDHYTKTCREKGIDQAVDNMAVMIKQYYAEDPDLGF